MAKNLVIVESPAKAKTIEGFLGKEFQVTSSFGHVRDLSKNQLGIDVEGGFIPQYIVPQDKTKIINELKKLSSSAEIVWLASDEDREGEAIAWHLVEALKLNESKIKRIVFHEITKKAILDAIENSRGINKNLVDAQQARRVLDRLVGYEMSPVLWKKVKPALSAGRVQSVAVRLIVERENEIKNFKITTFFKVVADFIIVDKNNTYVMKADWNEKFSSREEVINFFELCKNADFSIENIKTLPGKKSPAPPFTTSTLQQEASRKLSFSVAKTMMIAQQLYEEGKITYMRTDSVNLSQMALAMAKEEILRAYGQEYVKIRNYTTKTKGAQEAHEAIRPTYINNPTIKGTNDQKRLYELIWKRAIASQMSDAQLEKTVVTIKSSNHKDNFTASGEILKFDGFLKVYLESTDDDDDEVQKGVLPPLQIGQKLEVKEINATQKYSQHPPRYTEASLVKKLEDLGIGRPSTYAPTISTIQKREYVILETREGFKRDYEIIQLKDNKLSEKILTENTGYEKAKLFPTDIGNLVNNFLVEYFGNIVDYNFTANVEKEFDEIANGNKLWNEMIREFYGPFHQQVTETLEKSKKVSGERLLGVDPKSGKNVYAKLGRYGAMVQIGDNDSEEKPKFAGLLKGQSLDTITIDEALSLFSLPRTTGVYKNNDVIVSVGRFGPYIKYETKYYSLKKQDDPLSVTLERCIEIIEENIDKEKNKIINAFGDVKVLNGRWGPYISKGKENYKIPKEYEAASLTQDDCTKIIEESLNAPPKTKKRKK